MTETQEYYLGALGEIAKTQREFAERIAGFIANVEAKTGLLVKELHYDNLNKDVVVDWAIGLTQSRAQCPEVKTIKLTA